MKESLEGSQAETAPFRRGAHVLVCVDPKKKAFWRQARILSDGPSCTEPQVKYQVEYSGTVEELPEEQVVEPTQHGAPAMLLVAAERGEDVLVEELLDAGTNVFATDHAANTALIKAVDTPKPIDEEGSGSGGETGAPGDIRTSGGAERSSYGGEKRRS